MNTSPQYVSAGEAEKLSVLSVAPSSAGPILSTAFLGSVSYPTNRSSARGLLRVFLVLAGAEESDGEMICVRPTMLACCRMAVAACSAVSSLALKISVYLVNAFTKTYAYA